MWTFGKVELTNALMNILLHIHYYGEFEVLKQAKPRIHADYYLIL